MVVHRYKRALDDIVSSDFIVHDHMNCFDELSLPHCTNNHILIFNHNNGYLSWNVATCWYNI
jgi:hypothetical protein